MSNSATYRRCWPQSIPPAPFAVTPSLASQVFLLTAVQGSSFQSPWQLSSVAWLLGLLLFIIHNHSSCRSHLVSWFEGSSLCWWHLYLSPHPGPPLWNLYIPLPTQHLHTGVWQANMSRTELLTCPSKPAPLTIFPSSVTGNCSLSVLRPKTSGSSVIAPSRLTSAAKRM